VALLEGLYPIFLLPKFQVLKERCIDIKRLESFRIVEFMSHKVPDVTILSYDSILTV
jgi:hypothetical protein